MLLGIALIVIALIGLGSTFWEYKEAEDKHNELESEYVTFVDDKIPMDVFEGEEEQEVPWYELAEVNLTEMQKTYPDVVGWIMFEEEDISYPLLYGETNDEYIRSSYDKKSSTAGSIFVNSYNSPDLLDTHTIIYGHNMKNLSMFGKLKYYKTIEDYYQYHQYFQIFTENEIRRYKIFAYEEVEEDNEIYQQLNTSAVELSNKLRRYSMVSVEMDITDEDKIVTLSTCTSSDDYRFIVSAVWVDTYVFEMEE